MKRYVSLLLCTTIAISVLQSVVFAEKDESIVSENQTEALFDPDNSINNEDPENAAELASGIITAFGKCGTDLTWELTNDGTLTISGTGDMNEYSMGNTPWIAHRNSIKKVIFGDSVTSVCSFAFCKSYNSYDYANLTSVDFGGVKIIGESAFRNCTGLKTIDFGEVDIIGNWAFFGCKALTSIDLAKVSTIRFGVFSDCTGLSKVELANVSAVWGKGFYNCTGLKTIHFRNVHSFGDEAFSGCTGLTSVDMAQVYVLENKVFENCTNLTSVDLSNVSGIGEAAFRNCSRLSSIVIPSSVTSIGSDAFRYCNKLKKVSIYNNDIVFTGNSIFAGCHSDLKLYCSSGTATDTYAADCGIPVSKISPMVAAITHNGDTYDLLSQPINIDSESETEVSVKVNCENKTGKERIYITQNAEKAVELKNNIYTTFKPTSYFDATKDIYVLIINEETGESFSEKTRLKIVDNATNGEWFPDSGVEGLNFKLGKETGFTIPDSVAVFGGTEIKWDFDFIPISVEYDREDNNKINVVFGTSIASSDGEEDEYFKDFDFKEYKKDFKKAASKQGRTLKQLRNDFKMSNAYNPKMNLFGGKVIGGGSGKPSFDFDVAGYAEAKIIDGNFTFVEGQLCFEAEVSYTYQGQLFIWVVPVYYEIGGGIGAGFEGNMINIAPESFIPEFEAYITAKIKANIGAGIGVAKVATVGASGEGSLNLKMALHKDYLKAWGEGEANFNVKVFGKEVAKKPFAKGDFLIYETGNENGLISDSAVKLASLEDEDVYSGIDINKVYENESRFYASSSTEWYGDIPLINLMTADYTNKNLQLLAENVYTESAPMMCNIDGQKVMVMLWDNSERDAVNRTMIVYSIYDNETNSWSAPVPVYDDDTADFYPCFNDGYLVWQNEKALLNDSMTLLDIAKLGEIYVSKWNGNGFDEPIAITDNSAIDTQPFVCASDSEVSVVWTTNSENDIIGTSGSNSILKSTLADSNWGEAVIVKDNLNSIVNLSAGYSDAGLNIAYVVDGDNDLQTINERDICIITENEEYKLTDNDVLDSNPVFEGSMIYYYSNGNIEYAVLGSKSKTAIFEEMKAGLTDNFTVDANETGDVAIWWAKNTDNATEIFCTLYKDGEWSDEIQISDTDNQSKYPAGVLETDGSMYVAYNNSIWQDGSVIQSDLYTIDLLPSYDLSVIDAYIDEDSMMVYATIKNTGELNIDSYTLSLIDGDVNSQKVISEGLKAGESADVEIEYIKPENLDKRTITLSVSIDNEEYNSDNNSMDLIVGNCDVNITEIKNHEKLPDSLAVAVISNDGYSDTGKIDVCLRKETADGIILETQVIDNLAAGESTEISFSYDITENTNIQWYVTAEAENEEISLGNNDSYFINDYLSSVPDYDHEILRYSIGENSLVVNAHTENNTNDELSAISILAVYNKKTGRIKGIDYSHLNISKFNSVNTDFLIENYIPEESDYVKLFLLKDLNSIKSVCNPKISDIIVK